ncbi:hypothetical protein ACE103_13090 [Bradyrhizobium sp. ma5]|uniref:hypothetical protein n=1 Tax=unclassified Bradyrhizobium TaxID=2631580 RepID=UPI001CC5C2B1|nr:hypothetical protein [Bradyrhizobium sp. RD5-C2]
MFFFVIASHPVGAKRRRMTGSAKQSIVQQVEKWIASSLSLLAMTLAVVSVHKS